MTPAARRIVRLQKAVLSLLMAAAFVLASVLLVALFASCGGGKPTFGPPPWADTYRTLGVIECAIADAYGDGTAVEAMRTEVQAASDEFPFAGRYDPWGNRITVLASAPSAHASALRHEFFAHRVPDVLTGDYNGWDAEEWKATEEDLQAGARVCREGVSW